MTSPLLQFLKANNLKQLDICRYLDVSQPYISQVIRGKMKLSQPIFNRLVNNDQGWDITPLLNPAKSPQLDASTPTTDNAIEPEEVESEAPRILPSSIVNQRDVDLYQWYQENEDQTEFLNVDKLTSGSDFAIRVKSDMMYPRIKPNDIIYVQKLHKGDKIIENVCYFLDTNQGSFIGFVRVEDEQIFCAGYCGKTVVTLRKDDLFGVYRITNQISSYPVKNEEQNVRSLISRLETSDKRTDKLIDEIDRLIKENAKAGERVDRALELFAQVCAKIKNF